MVIIPAATFSKTLNSFRRINKNTKTALSKLHMRQRIQEWAK